MSNGRLPYLFDRYRSNQCSPEEVQELSVLCLLPENQAILEQLADRTWKEIPLEKEMPSAAGEEILQRILKPTFSEEVEEASGELLVVSGKRSIQLWKRIAAAASVVGIIFISYWLMKDNTTDDGQQTIVIQPTNDVKAPDKNRAQIKLADGTIVYLDSAANGELVDVNGVKVMKTEDGRIEYNGQLATGNEQVVYNTLINPRGSKVIDMTLADGSRVWLNAGSSVTYPIAFIDNERKVEITGEAYFEVNPHPLKGGKKIPFIVSKGAMQIDVLGTHFNVNAYDDESEIKVTLLEGSVYVSTKSDERGVLIKPGEQAKSNSNGQLSIDKNVDVEKAMAWKNNEFIFDDDDLNNIMRQLSYWYDIDVEFKGTSATNYSGRISRSASISKVLNMFEKLGYVKFEINGKKVKVINLK